MLHVSLLPIIFSPIKRSTKKSIGKCKKRYCNVIQKFIQVEVADIARARLPYNSSSNFFHEREAKAEMRSEGLWESLSKGFRSRYWAKVAARAKMGRRGRGSGEEKNFHFSINTTTPHQSQAAFVGESIFRIVEFRPSVPFLLFSSPLLSLFFALVPTFLTNLR